VPAIPAGLPSDLLERRPDLRRAEQNLIAANALIGAAKAAYFPTISLTGLFGYCQQQPEQSVRQPEQGVELRLADQHADLHRRRDCRSGAGRRSAQQQALFAYQKAIQEAFREVNDSLISQDRTREQLKAQKRQVEALQQYAATARLRYDNGYTSYIEVLDAERSLFNVQLQYTQTQQVEFQAMINLYLAMGGGWVNEAEKVTDAVARTDPGVAQ
jgi:multidrug efflux system outer membrane protein